MYLCDHGHKQLCHEAGYCPACKVAEFKDDRLSEQNNEIDDLEKKVESLETDQRLGTAALIKQIQIRDEIIKSEKVVIQTHEDNYKLLTEENERLRNEN